MFDVGVVGAGAAGLAAAQVIAAEGRAVLLVESARLGGECTWNGCVPSKALIEAARLRHAISRADRFGIRVSDARVDFSALMAHVRDRIGVIAGYEDAGHLAAAGITVRQGRARLGAGGLLSVDGQPVEARSVVVCTGSRPAIPPIPGLADVPYLTNETVFELEQQPSHLVVVGAGPIGLELAQAFARLGTMVEVFDLVDTLLPREDPDISRMAQTLLETEGLRFILGAEAGEVRHRNGTFEIDLAAPGGSQTLRGDALLVATGRRPNTESLGLEEAGVRVERTGVVVDGHMRTTAARVYAAGDVTGILPFTHAASYQGRIAGSNALGKRRKADHRVVPWATFTEPEIAHVGLTEPEARQRHRHVRTAVLPFSAIDRAVIQREPRGFLKLITGNKPVVGHAGGGDLLGAHIIGPGAGDLIHEFALAMQVRAFAGRLAQTIHAYPTMALGVQQATAQLFAAGRAAAGELREDLASDLPRPRPSLADSPIRHR